MNAVPRADYSRKCLPSPSRWDRLTSSHGRNLRLLLLDMAGASDKSQSRIPNRNALTIILDAVNRLSEEDGLKDKDIREITVLFNRENVPEDLRPIAHRMLMSVFSSPRKGQLRAVALLGLKELGFRPELYLRLVSEALLSHDFDLRWTLNQLHEPPAEMITTDLVFMVVAVLCGRNSKPSVITHAAEAFGRILPENREEVWNELVRLTESPESDVRLFAFWALSEIGQDPKETMGFLLQKAVSATEHDSQYEARLCFSRLAGRYPADFFAILQSGTPRAWEQIYRSNAACRIACADDKEGVWGEFVGLLGHSNEYVVAFAIEALGFLKYRIEDTIALLDRSGGLEASSWNVRHERQKTLEKLRKEIEKAKEAAEKQRLAEKARLRGQREREAAFLRAQFSEEPLPVVEGDRPRSARGVWLAVAFTFLAALVFGGLYLFSKSSEQKQKTAVTTVAEGGDATDPAKKQEQEKKKAEEKTAQEASKPLFVTEVVGNSTSAVSPLREGERNMHARCNAGRNRGIGTESDVYVREGDTVLGRVSASDCPTYIREGVYIGLGRDHVETRPLPPEPIHRLDLIKLRAKISQVKPPTNPGDTIPLFSMTSGAASTEIGYEFYGEQGEKLHLSSEKNPVVTGRGVGGADTLTIASPFAGGKGIIEYEIFDEQPSAEPVSQEFLDTYLELPAGIKFPTPLVAKMAEWSGLPPVKIADNLEYFIRHSLVYSLDQGLTRRYAQYYKEHPSDTFVDAVFSIGEAKCDEGNAAFVAAMRKMGIPARLATGFLVDCDGFIRYPRHAWAEIYLDGKWEKYDATPVSSGSVEVAEEEGKREDVGTVHQHRVVNLPHDPLYDLLAGINPILTVRTPYRPKVHRPSDFATLGEPRPQSQRERAKATDSSGSWRFLPMDTKDVRHVGNSLVYRVRAGNTLADIYWKMQRIARKKFGKGNIPFTDLASFAQYLGIKDPNLIVAGTTIVIAKKT